MPISILYLFNCNYPKETFFSNVEVDNVSYFYFCPDFYKPYKKGEIIEDSVVLDLYPGQEIIACCCICYKEICSICSRFEVDLSDRFLNDLKKLLIQNFQVQCNAKN